MLFQQIYLHLYMVPAVELFLYCYLIFSDSNIIEGTHSNVVEHVRTFAESIRSDGVKGHAPHGRLIVYGKLNLHVTVVAITTSIRSATSLQANRGRMWILSINFNQSEARILVKDVTINNTT